MVALVGPKKPELILQTGHESIVSGIAFSSGTIATAGRDSSIRLWDVDTRTEIFALAHVEYTPKHLQFDAMGQTLIGVVLRKIYAWDAVSRRLLRSMGPDPSTRDVVVALSSDGKTVASIVPASPLRGDHVRLWDASSGRVLRTLPGHLFAPATGQLTDVSCIAFSPDGNVIATGGLDDIILWNISTGSQLRRIENSSLGIQAFSFRPDGKEFAVTVELRYVTSTQKPAACATMCSVPPACHFIERSKLETGRIGSGQRNRRRA